MMKKQFWILILLLSLLLSGCAAIAHEEGEHREPINLAEWPTPSPVVPTATPTPFPKSTLPAPPAESAPEEEAETISPEAADLLQQLDPEADLTTLIEQLGDDADVAALLGQLGEDPEAAALLQTLSASGNAPALLQQLLASGRAQELLRQLDAGGDLSALLGTAGEGQAAAAASLVPVAISNIKTETADLRQRPDPAAPVLDQLEKGELGGVLGRDAGGNWLFVITIKNLRGWLPVETVRLVGDPSSVPVLPSDVLAALSRPAASNNTSTEPANASTDPAPDAPSAPPLDLAGLQPVTTARVSVSLLNMRQQPGPASPVVETLAEDTELELLALNERADWALVRTPQGNSGWIWLKNLAVSGSLESAPKIKAGELPASTASAPAGGNTSAPAVENRANSTASNAAVPVSVSSGGPALPANTLAALTTARINQKVDGRRGPSGSQGAMTTFTVDETVTVHGINREGDWVVVQGPNSRTGWVPLSALTLEGVLSGAPTLTTAWVESNEVEVKAGPGIYYETSGLLPINNMVSIIALNEGRSWALVESFSGGRGWIPLRFLSLSGSLAGVPEVAAPPVAEAAPLFPAEPAPLTGKLVFQTSSGGDIMIINSDGSGLRRLTGGIDPVLSPDGQQVAFTRWEGDVGTLWTINVDGSNERAVLGEMRKAKGPDWSPDGSQIILNFQHGGYVEERRECELLSPGSFPRLPRNATDVEVVIGSDGKPKLCYILPPDPHWSLRLVNLSDGSFEDLYGGQYAFRPAWDPAQPWRIVSDAGNGLLAVDINRDDYRQYLTEELQDSSPAISPDGRQIAVTMATQGGYDIFRLNADGSGRTRLTETPLWVPVQPESEGKVWNNVAPTWSPDSSQMAFLTDRTGRWEIWVMGADGSNPRPMFLPEVNEQLNLQYNFVDERVLSWR